MFCHYVSYEHFSELFALCTEKLAFITFMSICQTKTYVGTMYFHEIYVFNLVGLVKWPRIHSNS